MTAGRPVKIVALVVLAGLLLLSSVYTVQPEEVGVILRLGKYAGTTEPGLRFKIPLIDRLTKVPVRRQLKEEFGFRSGERCGAEFLRCQRGRGEDAHR